MTVLAVTLALAAMVAAPYALVMAMPRLSHALVAALAVAVPLLLSTRHIGLDRFEPRAIVTSVDAALVAAALLSLVTALFARTAVAALGERARRGAAFVTLNVIGLALALSVLPWLGTALAHMAP